MGLVGACENLVTPSLYGTVEVMATRRDGAPIEGIPFLLYTGARPIGYGSTDSAGFLRFSRVPPNGYGLRATVPAGYARIEDLIGGKPSDFVDGLLLAEQGMQTVRFTFLKRGLGAVTATIVEPNGAPVANVPLNLYTSSGNVRSAISDASGRFTFDGVPFGAYGIFARRSAVYTDVGEPLLLSRDNIIVEEATRDSVRFVFTRCTGRLTTTVRDDAGQPVRAASVLYYTSTGGAFNGATGADGTLSFPAAPCGDYGVSIGAPLGYAATPGRGTSFADGLHVSRDANVSSAFVVQVLTGRSAAP